MFWGPLASAPLTGADDGRPETMRDCSPFQSREMAPLSPTQAVAPVPVVPHGPSPAAGFGHVQRTFGAECEPTRVVEAAHHDGGLRKSHPRQACPCPRRCHTDLPHAAAFSRHGSSSHHRAVAQAGRGVRSAQADTATPTGLQGPVGITIVVKVA